jgi:mitochondrial import inner membrane translocase subunit TIM22
MSQEDGAGNKGSSGQSNPKLKGALMAPPIYDIIMSNRLTESKYHHRTALHREVPLRTTADAKNRNPEMAIDSLTRLALPFCQPWSLSPSQQAAQVPPDFSWLGNNCGGKAAIGLVAGGAMGLVMGVFLGAMSDATPPVTLIGGKEVPQAPLREQLKVTLRATAEKSKYWCRQFAFITGVFGGTDCLVEKFRGKHDVWNSVASGCITGAALQAKQGPQAAAIGCGGFAAFSLVIDTVMGTH